MTPVALLLVPLLLASPRAGGPWGLVVAPADTSTPRPAIVFLHGMWASPEDSCPSFADAATAFGFLVCPRGNAPLGEGKMWSGGYGDAVGNIHAALDAAAGLAEGKLQRTGGTLLGFSNGAYFAAEVALHEPGRWTGLILMSMKLSLDPKALSAAGVRRVLLAAGDADGARDAMHALAQHLDAPPLESRFVSLGPIGHTFPADMNDRMCRALAWARNTDDRICAGAPSPSK